MFDIAIVGGGIVGLATGVTLLKHSPSLRVIVLEKESSVATHQTGHNSGVIHSGIYYKPGSLKARLCVEGVQHMTAFCDEHGIRYERCGKVIVATDNREVPALEELYGRGMANGVPGLRKISREELLEIEPHVAGIAALHSPNTGIVDYAEVARAMAAELVQRGARVQTGAEVLGIHQDGSGLRIETTAGEIAARFLINCAGLYSDVVARQMGVQPDLRIIPFRGEYYFLRHDRQDLVRGLIYPVPDPEMPFLGVHFTRTVHGQVEAGPNAVLAFAREGYTKGRIHPGELWGTLSYPGFQRLARRFWRTGVYEYYRSFSKAEFVRGLQRLVPAIKPEDIAPGGAGVRAQAVARDGNLVDDFRVVELPRAIHVLNAPSPAATASLAIGHYVGKLAMDRFQFDTPAYARG